MIAQTWRADREDKRPEELSVPHEHAKRENAAAERTMRSNP